ncbi:MAG: hypothetical protein J6A89_05160 [Clostridia bacterium]|nr:hypothetical protein [Clostridia bacterium]
MKKSVKILIIVLILIIVGLATFIVVDKVINNKKEDVAEINSVVDNAGQKDESDNEQNKISESENKVNSNNKTNDSTSNFDIEKIDISIENKLLIAHYLEDFENVNELTTEDMLNAISRGLNYDWIKLESIVENDRAYSEKQIKSVVYSVFGVELKENKSVVGLEYKNGNYRLTQGDGDPIPVLYNLTTDVAAGTVYCKYEIYKVGNIGIYSSGKKYQVIVANDVLKSKETIENNGEGEYSYTENIDSSDFIKTWDSPIGSQITIYENGTFLKDNYTASSEIKGTYKIDGASIEFTTEDGKKWNGQMVMEGSGNNVLTITIDEEILLFWDPLAED